jgi:adenylate/nucleoside-diphosphate kinase
LISAEQEISQIAEVVAALEGSGKAQIIEINANRFIRPVVSEIKKKLASFTENRISLFLNPFKISKAKAATMLKLGIKEYSSCG